MTAIGRRGIASLPFMACLILLAAEILQVLSFAAPFWAYVDNSVVDNNNYRFTGYIGLWRYHQCDEGITIGCNEWYFRHYTSPWRDAVRAMESIAIILIALPLLSIPLYFYVALGLYYKGFFASMAAFTFLGAICNIIGVIVHGIFIGYESSWQVGWCLIVCIVGGVFDLVAVVVLLIAMCNKPVFVADYYYNSAGLYVDPDKNKLYAVEHVEPAPVVRVVDDRGQVNPAADIND